MVLNRKTSGLNTGFSHAITLYSPEKHVSYQIR